MVGRIGLGIFGLYMLAVMPKINGKKKCESLLGWEYAHRGFHDNQSEAPENSLPAFQKAVDRGYGIEWDVQLTKDRIPVIFHDETLDRVCNVPGKVRDYTWEEIKKFTLYDSKERIPLFEEGLKLVDGKIPLVIEIKMYENKMIVCEKVDEVLKKYNGLYCIESFHPLALRWYRKNRPQVVRGQLSSNFNKPEERETMDRVLVHYLLTNFLAKPDFIAYDIRHKQNISRRICCNLYGSMSAAWTVRSQKEMDDNKKDFALHIFEGFTPK